MVLHHFQPQGFAGIWKQKWGRNTALWHVETQMEMKYSTLTYGNKNGKEIQLLISCRRTRLYLQHSHQFREIGSNWCTSPRISVFLALFCNHLRNIKLVFNVPSLLPL